MTCGECGASAPAGAVYCGRCGGHLGDEGSGRGAARGRPGTGAWVAALVVVGTVITTGAVIGRDDVAGQAGAGGRDPGRVALPTGQGARASGSVSPSASASVSPSPIEVVVRPAGCDRGQQRSLACPTWAASSPGGFGEPTVTGREVVVGTATGVGAIRPDDGGLLWSTVVGARVQRAPTVDESHVYVVDERGVVTALERGSGQRRWQTEVGGDRLAPVVAGDTVIMATMDQIVGLAAETGERRWTVAISGLPSLPTVGADAVYVVDGDGNLRALDRDTGDVLWQRGEPGRQTTLADHGRVLLLTGAGPLRGLDARTGETMWVSDLYPDTHFPDRRDRGPTIHVQAAAGLLAVDARDGSHRRVAEQAVAGQLLVDDAGMLHVAHPIGRLLTLDEAGEQVAEVTIAEGLRTVTAGTVEGAAWLVAIGGSGTLISAPAPTAEVPGAPSARPELPPGAPCPATALTERPYTTVAAGDHVEIAGLGTSEDPVETTLVIDPDPSDLPVTLRGHQLDGPGVMRFRLRYDASPRPTVVLSQDGRREASGWPTHFGVVASVTGPGCWTYLATTADGETDQLIVQIDESTWAELPARNRL